MSSSDNDPKKAEEMSLAELLGKSEAASIPPDAVNEEESDDDKSGLINLSQMASMLAAPAAAPTSERASVPGAPMTDPGSAHQVGGAGTSGGTPSTQPYATGCFPSSAPATAGAYTDVATPVKKKPVAAIVIAAIALMAGCIGAFVALSGGDDSNKTDTTVADLNNELANAHSNAATDSPAAEPEAAEPEVAEPEAAAPSAAEIAKSADAEEAEADADAEGSSDEEYEATEEVDDGKGGKKRRRVKRAKRRTATKAATTKTKTATKAAPAPAKTEAIAEAPKKKSGKTSELDSLLASGSGGSARDSGGIPQKPSRAQVQQAMAPVVRKARNSCRNSGSGKVSVRIVVGSNGVVRDAIPLGAHSADSLGRCVATFARKTARLPAFKAPTFTFTFPFNI